MRRELYALADALVPADVLVMERADAPFIATVATGGRNRTLGELQELVEGSGFELQRVIKPPTPTSAREAFAA